MLRLDGSPALDGSAPATWLQSAAAVLFTAAVLALGMSLVAVATLPLLKTSVGRIVAVGIQAAFMGWLTLSYLVSVLLRTLSGSYLTVGAIEFGLNGNSHLFEAALSGFRVESVLLVAMVSLAVVALVLAPMALGTVGTMVLAPAILAPVLGLTALASASSTPLLFIFPESGNRCSTMKKT